MRALFASLGLILACSGAPADSSAPRIGSFRYSALSATGQPLLAGHIEFAFPDDSTLTGTWAIAWLPGADTTEQVGPQVGSGVLIGAYRGGTLLIQLNPTNADNNVALQAVPSAGGYAGHWDWITATGPRSGGAFVAGQD